jgi:7-cyano-7-deazaguanine synthase
MKKAVILFSGGVDSICVASYLKSKYDLYGISFSYGQKADREVITAKTLKNWTKTA